MSTHFENALHYWYEIKINALEFGRECQLAIETEGKTIRDISMALCGNVSLEDKIGRYIMAAQFNDSLNSATYGNIKEHLSASHYTELQKVEEAFDRDTALEILQEIVTENPDETMNVKPVEWVRSKRMELQGGPSLDERKHRLWSQAARLLNDLYSDLERKGELATKQDRRMLRLIKMVLAAFQAVEG
jgi:hypothetical protein